MTTNRSIALTFALALAAGPASALQARLVQRSPTEADLQARADERLAEARLHAELGGHEKALEVYRALAEDAAQPLRVRGRALLGAAVMQGRLDASGAGLDAFFRAIEVARELEDVELARDIVEASGAVRPAAAGWGEIEPLLEFERREEEGGNEIVVPPPGLQPAATATATVGGSSTLRRVVHWPEREYTGMPISLSVEDADLVDLFRMFQEISGLNIVVDPALEGETVTLDVANVPWDEVLAIVMRTNGLDSRFEGDVLRIAPKEKLVAEDERRSARREAQELAGEVRSVARTLSHADGQVALERVRGMLTARGRAQLDRRTNTLIVKDFTSRVREVEDFLDRLDSPREERFTGMPVSISLSGADVGDLFRFFSEISGLSFKVDDRMRGRTWDLVADGEPWDSVLHRLLSERGLILVAVGESGHVVLPRPADDVSSIIVRVDGTERLLYRPAGGWGDGAPDVLPPIVPRGG